LARFALQRFSDGARTSPRGFAPRFCLPQVARSLFENRINIYGWINIGDPMHVYG
jgi:hypothetical protein